MIAPRPAQAKEPEFRAMLDIAMADGYSESLMKIDRRHGDAEDATRTGGGAISLLTILLLVSVP